MCIRDSNPADCYTLQQQEEAAALGAYVEHSFFTTYHGRTPIEEIARQIRAVGCEKVLLTTDFGQPASPCSDEGLEEYAGLLDVYKRQNADYLGSYGNAANTVVFPPVSYTHLDYRWPRCGTAHIFAQTTLSGRGRGGSAGKK